MHLKTLWVDQVVLLVLDVWLLCWSVYWILSLCAVFATILAGLAAVLTSIPEWSRWTDVPIVINYKLSIILSITLLPYILMAVYDIIIWMGKKTASDPLPQKRKQKRK